MPFSRCLHSPSKPAKTGFLAIGLALALASGCRASSHPVVEAKVGRPIAVQDMLANLGQPGPVEVETVVLADWQVERGGLINLHHDKAKQAGLQKGLEPILIYAHALRHPKYGLFLIDTGLDSRVVTDPKHAVMQGALAKFMQSDKIKIKTTLKDWIAKQDEPLRGVFLTHMHLDHASGLVEVPHEVPIYAGPGETHARSLLNGFVRKTTNRALAGKKAVQEFVIKADPSEVAQGHLDIFGDGSVFALWEPGHTPGSMAYLVRSTKGPVLFVGDTSHTRWGWDHGVEPGKFSADRRANALALTRLLRLAEKVPSLDVRLGHQ